MSLVQGVEKAVSAVVHSTTFSQNYEQVIKSLSEQAFAEVVKYFENVVDENQNKLHFNFADICNVLTNVAQAARAVEAAKNQPAAPTVAPVAAS